MDIQRQTDHRETTAGSRRRGLLLAIIRLTWRNFVQTERGRLQSVPATLVRWENWIGLIFPAWLAASVGFWMIHFCKRYWSHGSPAARAGWIAAGVLWLSLDVPYLYLLVFVARNRLTPFALQAAQRMKLSPVVLRPVIAAWWLGHFAAPFWIVGMMARHPPPGVKVPVPFEFFMMLVWGATSNGFLLLAGCALTPSSAVRRAVWRFRVITDVGLAIVAIGIR